jgi:hypothetical protein
MSTRNMAKVAVRKPIDWVVRDCFIKVDMFALTHGLDPKEEGALIVVYLISEYFTEVGVTRFRVDPGTGIERILNRDPTTDTFYVNLC